MKKRRAIRIRIVNVCEFGGIEDWRGEIVMEEVSESMIMMIDGE